MPFKDKKLQALELSQYMHIERLGWLAVEEKNKKAKKTTKKAKRLKEKVYSFEFLHVFLSYTVYLYTNIWPEIIERTFNTYVDIPIVSVVFR